MKALAIMAAVLHALTMMAGPCLAQSSPSPGINEVIASLGGAAVRAVETDIALPANTAEYEAMGKNAVLMLEASTALPSELPLRSTYVVFNDVRVPLQRLATLPAWEATERRGNEDETYTHQISFYLIPIYLLKQDAWLMVDFQGRREGFRAFSFPVELTGAPPFIRADDYDYPSEPDLEAAATMTVREFPSSFGSAEQ
jgi:hypothetical protein